MDPEEKELLLRSIALSEENNQILLGIKKKAHWAMVWGFIKFFVIVLPLVASYFYLQPYIGSVGKSLNEFKQLLNQ